MWHPPLPLPVSLYVSVLMNFYHTRPVVQKLDSPIKQISIWETNSIISYRAVAWHYRIFPDFLKSPVSKQRIVRVKSRTKAFFFEDILINIPPANLPKLKKERMQYFCIALKLNLRIIHGKKNHLFSKFAIFR